MALTSRECVLAVVTVVVVYNTVQCEADEWWTRNDARYLYVERKLNWHQAVSYCRERGMQLVTPRDREENKWLHQQVWERTRLFRSVWIGVNDIETEGEYVDTDGIPVTFNACRWCDYGDSKDCLVLGRWWYMFFNEEKSWYDQPCSNRLSFVCKSAYKCIYNPCHPNARCYNHTGIHQCICKTGYSGNGTYCEDVNECSSSPCHVHGRCINSNGSFACQCKLGYSGNGFSCQDVDECALHPCVDGAYCVNTDGSYNCRCRKGFTLTAVSCEDINECLDSPCDPNARCSNTAGSYFCRCNDGFSGDGWNCKAAPFVDETLDPCNPSHVTVLHHLLSDIPQRSANFSMTHNADKLLCDRTLREGWYFFGGPTQPGQSSLQTLDMPTHCVEEYRCGTRYPIWLTGTLPSPNEGIVNRQACLATEDNCCAYTIALKLKACSPQLVAYYLTPTERCYAAYCFGDHVPCPNGEVSPTGFSPGCRPSNVTELQIAPLVSLDVHGDEFNFTCNVTIPDSGKEREVNIVWLAGDIRIQFMKDIARHSIVTDNLYGKTLASYFGRNISCKARYFTTGGVYSQWRISDIKPYNIEVLSKFDQPVEIDENEVFNVTFRLAAPYIGDQPLDIVSYVPEGNTDGAYCSDGEPIPQLVTESSCGVQITRYNWQNNHVITLRATVDGKIERNQQATQVVKVRSSLNDVVTDLLPSDIKCTWCRIDCRLLHINNKCYLYSINFERFSDFNGVRKCGIKQDSVESSCLMVFVKDKDRMVAMCRSTNDPHMTSFDGMHYELQKPGEFVLYKHKTEPLEVHAQYKSCNQDGSKPFCNCAVFILARGDVIVIDKCGKGVINLKRWRLPNRLRYRAVKSCKGFDNVNVLQENGGKKYEVTLYTGTTIIVEDSWSSFINLYVVASLKDLHQTEGLCGQYDRDCSNDLIPKEQNSLPSGYSTSCGYSSPRHPDEFTESWRVSDKKNLFNKGSFDHLTNPSSCDKKVYCVCGDSGDSCEIGNDVPKCGPKPHQRKIDSKTLPLTRPSRKRRNVDFYDHYDFMDYDESDYSFVSQPRDDDMLPKHESHHRERRAEPFNEETARQYCYNYVFNTQAGQKCSELGIDTDSPIAACVLDLMATDDPNWATAALDAVKQQCLSELDKNTTRWVPRTPDSNVTVPPPDIEGVICFNECSGNGACVNGSCVCNESFSGPDCSINITAAPLLFYTPMCDQKTRPCKTNPVIGNNFLENDNLTCHFYQQKIGPNGLVSNNTEGLNKSAVFNNYAEVTCPLPEIDELPLPRDLGKPIAYKVHISNDGVQQSRYGVLIVFNSICFSCDINTTSCTENTNSCTIGGRCYAPKEHDVLKCKVCEPSVSRTSWTMADNACVIDGMCYQAGQQKPEDICLICDPQKDRTSWSKLLSSSCLTVSTAKSVPPTEPKKNSLVAVIVGTSGGLAAVVIAATAAFACVARSRKRQMNVSSQKMKKHKLSTNMEDEHVL